MPCLFLLFEYESVVHHAGIVQKQYILTLEFHELTHIVRRNIPQVNKCNLIIAVQEQGRQ